MDIDEAQAFETQQFEHLIEGLINNQYGCIDNFINKNSISGLRNNLQNLNLLEKLSPAGLGKALNFKKNQQIRGDKIKWIEPESKNEYEIMFQQKMINFISYLNRTCFTSILEFESHYASYKQKSFYKKHIDQFKNDKGRKYSIIIYLNESWLEEDGGNLSLYPVDGAQIDIAPIGGRMVFFKSDEMEHEVHPSFTKDRISIAGWLKN